jgi:hypothetical protein
MGEQIFRNLKSFRYDFYNGKGSLDITCQIEGGTVRTSLDNVPIDQYGLIVEHDDLDEKNEVPQLRIIES